MSIFKKRNTKIQIRHLLLTLDSKLQLLIQSREDIETQLTAAQNVEEKKALVQETIDLTHQIQALRIVIDLFKGNEK